MVDPAATTWSAIALIILALLTGGLFVFEAGALRNTRDRWPTITDVVRKTLERFPFLRPVVFFGLTWLTAHFVFLVDWPFK